MSALFFSFLLGMLGSWIVSIFLIPASEDKLHKFVVKYFGSEKQKNRSLSGNWSQCWSVDSENFDVDNKSEVKIKQFKNWIYTTFYTGGNKYICAGKIDQERFVTGKWFGEIKGDYHGSFQLHISPNGKEMKGVWAGFDKANNIKTGLWNWERGTSDDGRKEPTIDW